MPFRTALPQLDVMHLSDGFLSATTCAVTSGAAAAAVGWALHRTRQSEGDRLVPLMGMMSACIFSAQMVNFPVLAGTSGHLVGGVLAAVVLGPWAGLLAMTVVLIVQCLLFYDGGLTVLGANVLNMAVFGSLAGYGVYAFVRRGIAGSAGIVAGSVVAAWVAVMLSAVACSIELAASGIYPLHVVMPAMLIVHSAIGVGEALITGTVVAFIVRARPELIYAPESPAVREVGWRRVAVAGAAVALGVALVLAPLASASPDGLERVASELGDEGLAVSNPPVSAQMPDYEMPGFDGLWIATSLAGVVGAAVTFALAWGLARGLARAPSSD